MSESETKPTNIVSPYQSKPQPKPADQPIKTVDKCNITTTALKQGFQPVGKKRPK